MNIMKATKRFLWRTALLCFFAGMYSGDLLYAIPFSRATFEFSSPSSKLVLGDYAGGHRCEPYDSYFKATSANACHNAPDRYIVGWDQESIVAGFEKYNVKSYSWTTSLGGGLIAVVHHCESDSSSSSSTSSSSSSSSSDSSDEWEWSASKLITRDLLLTTSEAAKRASCDAKKALSTANTASQTATVALNSAGAAQNTANTALTKANAAQTTANTALVTANVAKAEADKALKELAELGIQDNGPIIITTSPYTLSYDLQLSYDNLLIVNKTTTIDGNGHRISFARNSSNIFQLASGVAATLTNVVLHDFDDAALKFNDGASIVYGAKTTIELPTDVTMMTDWVCTGDVIINGNGSALDFAGHTISVGSANEATPVTVVFENITLNNIEAASIVAARSNCTVILRNALLNLDVMTWPKGTLQIEGDVVLSGQGIFTFSANQQLVITSSSSLTIDANNSFVYAPSEGSRYLISMAGPTAALVLNGCFFYAPAPGIELVLGTLVVKANNNLYNPNAQSLEEAITFGDDIAANDLSIDIQPGASINLIEGKLDYRNSN